MAADEAWTCSICRDVQQDVAYVIPCNHMFCFGCIQQWARLRNSCPLCRRVMQTIRVCAQGDNPSVEYIVSPPAVTVPVTFGTATATGPDSDEASLPPPPPPSPELTAAEPERVGGHLPEEWAALFRVRQDILNAVLPWLEQQLSHNRMLSQWQINLLKNMIVSHLCQVGLHRDALVQRLQGMLGSTTIPFTDMINEANLRLWGQETRRLLGLEDPSSAQEQEDGPAAPSSPSASPSAASSGSSAGPDAQELPGTSSETLGGTVGEVPRAPSPGEREQPGEEPQQEPTASSEQSRTRGSSSRGRGRNRSAGPSRRTRKRKAGSTQRAPPPCKRRRPRRL